MTNLSHCNKPSTPHTERQQCPQKSFIPRRYNASPSGFEQKQSQRNIQRISASFDRQDIKGSTPSSFPQKRRRNGHIKQPKVVVVVDGALALRDLISRSTKRRLRLRLPGISRRTNGAQPCIGQKDIVIAARIFPRRGRASIVLEESQ